MDPQWGISCVPGPLFNVIVKFPIVLSDIATTILIYTLVLNFYGISAGEKAALLFYLNPAVIWISSAWGQYDSVPTMFTLLSLYTLFEKRFFQSSLSLLAATLFKVYPVGLVLPITIYLLRKGSFRGSLRFLSAFLVSGSLLLIFGSGSALRFLYNFLHIFPSWSFHGIFGFGLTYWSVSMLYPLDIDTFNVVSNGIMILLILLSLYSIHKFDFDDQFKDLTFSAVLIAASIFLSHRYPTEQRIVWLLPFLAIATSKGHISERVFWALSLVAFLYMQKTFPHYLLPIATFNADLLLPLFRSTEQLRTAVQETLMPTPTSAAILSALGIIFSILMLRIYLHLSRVVGLVEWKGKQGN